MMSQPTRLPAVSVYITSYNHEAFIRKSLDSTLSQEYENLEVVVSDDASTDSSPHILKEYARNFPDKVRVNLNTSNMGSTANRKIAMTLCRGDYIASLDSDDAFLPGKIKKQVEFMEAHPEYTITYHDCLVIDRRSERVLYRWKERYGKKQGGSETLVRYGNFLCSPTVMIRRKGLPAEELNPDFKVGADWIFFIQMLQKTGGKIGFLDEVLAYYYRHSHNITLDWDSKLESRLKTLDSIDSALPGLRRFSRQYRSDLHLMQAIQETGRRGFLSGFQQFWLAFKLSLPYPWNMFRLPGRELAYLVKQKLNLDDLLSSLLGRQGRI